MAEVQYERLSSLDASFLALETRSTHMHVASISVFDGEGLKTEAGGVDIARMRAFIDSRLQYVPRYRQRLAWVPLEGHPVWVDDEHFNLEYHVRHESLPAPGTEAQLRQLTGRMLSQQLDRSKPLWEMTVIEGLDDGRIAIVSKIHHCMIDGMAGAGLLGVILNVIPTSEIEDPSPWTPTPPPSDVELAASEITRRIQDGVNRMKDAKKTVDETQLMVFGAIRKARAAWYSLTSGWLTQAPATPLNEPIGPNRRFDGTKITLADIKTVRAALGGTVNDVVLATTAGAVRTFLTEHRQIEGLDIEFRVMAPVSVRPADAGGLGNQVAMWLVELPLSEPDPVARLEAIKTETQRLKKTDQALGASTIVAASSGTPHTLVSLGARLATGIRPFNMTVTNVPGPQFPMYLLESQLVSQYPVVPLWHGHGVGIALFSYNGDVAWGITGDWDVLSDIEKFTECIQDAFAELMAAAGAEAQVE